MKTLKQILEGVAIVASSGSLDTPVSGVFYDSRQSVEGGCFVCVRGAKSDGHAFIAQALAGGARAVVAETGPPRGFAGAFVRVPDGRKALAAMAASFYDHPAQKLRMIGVTGTNGKTTTTLLIESILKHAGYSPGVIGTLGYRWAGEIKPAPMTTPESLDLQRMLFEMHRAGVTHAVMEVSSHALAMGRVEGCSFRAGVFTNLSQDHLDFHATMEEYFAVKALLFSRYLAPGAPWVVNADDPYGQRLIENGATSPALAWTYSTAGEKARVRVLDARLSPQGISCTLDTPRGELALESPLIGRLNLYNVLGAATLALAQDIPAEAIRAGVRDLSFVDGRLQRIPVPPACGFDVVVDYAHTPDAMEKTLTCLREMAPHGRGRLIAVFGCGGDRDRGKRPLMGGIAAQMADVVIVTSDNPRSELPEKIIEEIEGGIARACIACFEPSAAPPREKCYTKVTGRREAIDLALSLARPGDIVFIGGKGHETYQIAGGKTYPFDDRLVVCEYFDKSRVSEIGDRIRETGGRK